MVVNQIKIEKGLVELLKSKRVSSILLDEVLPLLFPEEGGPSVRKVLKGVTFELYSYSSAVYRGVADFFYSPGESQTGGYLKLKMERFSELMEVELKCGTSFIFNLGGLFYFESSLTSVEPLFIESEGRECSAIFIEIDRVVTGISSRLYKMLHGK